MIPKVLYITGWGRSGTTIVDRICGQIGGFVSVGELRSLWDADPNIHLCGCGETVIECPLWGAVLQDVSTGNSVEHYFESMRKMRQRSARTRDLPRLWWRAKESATDSKKQTQYSTALLDLYRSILKHSDAEVVVDSSKHPSDALVLIARSDVTSQVLHMIRDPRGVAFSWAKPRRIQPDGKIASGEPPEKGIFVCSIWWTIWNGAIEALIRPNGQVRRLRYEDFVEDPLGSLTPVISEFGALLDGIDTKSSHSFVLRPTHTVAGNPSRHETGEIEIRQDEAWKKEMPVVTRILSTLGSFPLLRFYRYPIFTKRQKSRALAK